MSVNLGGVASGAGEKRADELVGLGEGDAAASGVGELEGRAPANVADGGWARATPWQVRKMRTETIVFTTLYFGRIASLVDSVAIEEPIGEKLLAAINFFW